MLRLLIGACLLLLALPLAARAESADGGVRIVVPARDIARGETIAESDLAYQTAPAAQVRAGAVTSMDDLDGMQARRVLRAGEALRPGDVRHPVLVTKGMLVTMQFEAPGVLLTVTGKAMSEGGLGESVVVLNPVSYRQITATVTGPGTVHTEAGAAPTNQLAAARP